MKAIVLGVSLLLSVACASSSAPGKGASATEKGASGGDVTTTQALANADADADNTYICEKVKPTGSNIPEEVCKTVRQRRQERENAQRLMLRPRTEANKSN